MCYRIAGQCKNLPRPFLLPLTDDADQQVNAIGSLLNVAEKQNNIIDWPFQWQVVFDAMRHRKAGTLRTLVTLPSVILQPFMRVQDQRKLMSTKGINVSENEW